MKKDILSSIFIYMCFCLSAYGQTMKEHIVQRGETFAVIAKRYGMTEEQIKAANPTRKTCYVGLKLSIPVNQITTSSTRLTYTPSSEEKSSVSKNGKSFWESLGEFANTAGNIIVGTTGALAETGLLDETGNVGNVMAFSADVVNLTRGQSSNFISQSEAGRNDISGAYDGNIESRVTQVNYDTKSVEEIDRQIAALRAEDERLERMKYRSLVKGYDYTAGKNRSEIRKMRKEQMQADRMSSKSNTRRGASYATTNKEMSDDLTIAKRQSEIRQEIKRLKKIKAQLVGDPDVANEQSAFERERSMRSKAYSDPKVKTAREKAANIKSWQTSINVSNDEIWKLKNQSDYRPELTGEEREKEIKKHERNIAEKRKLITD